jgi:Mn-dependent DtxR family transcriptional regulator
MARSLMTPMGMVREVAAALAQRGYVTVDGDTVSVTESGRRVAATLLATQEEILNEFPEEWSPHDHPDVEAVVAEFSARLLSEQWVSGRA